MTEPNAGSTSGGANGRGYQLLPGPHPGSPGYSGLLVSIRETPTETHSGPESMRLQTLGQNGAPYWRTFRREPPLSGAARVCPNWVTLLDRAGNETEFFTFGGSLESAPRPGETAYSLRSPAPILQLAEVGETLPNLLASETEAMIAELRAKEANEQAFDRRLAQADPLNLYAATVDSILKRYQGSAGLRQYAHGLYMMLLEEKDWLQKTYGWTAGLPSIGQVLFL